MLHFSHKPEKKTNKETKNRIPEEQHKPSILIVEFFNLYNKSKSNKTPFYLSRGDSMTEEKLNEENKTYEIIPIILNKTIEDCHIILSNQFLQFLPSPPLPPSKK